MSEQPGFIQGQQRIDALAAELTANNRANSFAKQDAIEARLRSPEMRDLNDAAEIAIFGSRGRSASFKPAEGYVDPSTGAPITEPIKGKIDEIRENHRYGKGQTERDAAASKYQQDVEALVDDGLELTQAKLVMDKRESWAEANEQHKRGKNLGGFKHKQKIDKRIALIEERYIKDGLDPEEAHTKALVRASHVPTKPDEPATETVDIAAEEAKLKKTLKSEGIFTAAEYDAFVNGDAAPDPDKTGKTPEAIRQPESRTIRYEADEDGNVDFVKEFTTDGDVVDLSKLPETSGAEGREVIVTTETGARYLIDENALFDVFNSQRDHEAKLHVAEFKDADNHLIPIGEPWQWRDGHFTDGAVAKIEVLDDWFHQDDPGLDDAGYHEMRRGEGSFNEVDTILADLERQAEALQALDKEAQDRTAARTKVRSPRPAPPAKKGRTKRAMEALSNRRKAIAGAVLGRIAMAHAMHATGNLRSSSSDEDLKEEDDRDGDQDDQSASKPSSFVNQGGGGAPPTLRDVIEGRVGDKDDYV